jgi:DNA invertase Pin-like site-specific DNA recombinase
MIKTTYFCDCCKQIIPDDADHIQMVPMNETVDAFTGALSGYEKMVDAHFCRACTDKIISFMFQPVDVTALEASIKEDQDIIATLNAELEEARKALKERPEEQPAEEAIEESDPPAPATAKIKQHMTGKRSPVDKQQVIRLYRDNHMTYQQIADRVGCSVTTIYSIVRKHNKTAPAPTEEPEVPAEETNE